MPHLKSASVSATCIVGRSISEPSGTILGTSFDLESLTLLALGIDGALYRTLRTTNPIENLNGLIAQYTANVKRWRDGQMLLRWIGAALTEARRADADRRVDQPTA